MKTQRPRGDEDRRQALGSNQLSSSSNGSPQDEPGSNDTPSTQQAPMKAIPPPLPKRKVSRQNTAEPGNGKTAVILDNEAQGVASRGPSLPPASQPAEAEATASQSDGGWRAYITYETVFYAAIFALAFFSRFYDLGDRALHHDESLHAVYSRNLYSGIGYRHDPMMHGPLQFHFIAPMYWLFGTADATARFASALCGLFVVMSPLFLRRQMGRIAALVCSVLLLVSPSILYFSRMAREDAIFSGMETLMIVGLWRFLSTRKPGDFYIFCAGLSLMFTIKETAYLTVAVLGVLFVLLFAYQSGYSILAALAGYLVTLGGVMLAISNGVKSGSIPKLPDIPDTEPDWNKITTFANGFLTHPFVYGSVLVTLVFAVIIGLLFYMKSRQLRDEATGEVEIRTVARRRPASASIVSSGSVVTTRRVRPDNGSENGHSVAASPPAEIESDNAVAAHPAQTAEDVETQAPEVKPLWNPGGLTPKRGTLFSHYEQGSLPYLVGGLMARPSVLLIGFSIAATIFIVLYSVFFTDVPRGIASGMFASLGYWIAQQGVARGSQPWFFYFIIIPMYEPIAALFSVVAGIFFSWRGIRWLFRNRIERADNDLPRLTWYNIDRSVPFARFGSFLPLFVGWWLLGAVFIYSWAGEKMPWLTMHMVRPAIFFTSLVIGAVVAKMITSRRKRLVEADLYQSPPYEDKFKNPARMPAGARFSLAGALNTVGLGGQSRQRLAYEPGVTAANQFNSVRATQASQAMRTSGRRGSVGSQPQQMVSVQEPPWVSWNRPDSIFPFASFLVLFMLLAVAWGLSMSQQNYDVLNRSGNYSSWGVTWLYPALMLVLVVSYAIWLGVGRALRYVAMGILSVMLFYQLHSGITLSYRQPDVSTELASYVQTSPDVTRVIRELETYSFYTTGTKDVKVIYDSEVSWPMEWYLGEYKNKQFIGAPAPTLDPNNLAPVMFLGYDRLTDENILKYYTAQRYALRWWFPEEWYKDRFIPNAQDGTPLQQLGDALHTIGVTIFQPEYQATLWRYLMYKIPPNSLGSTDFGVFLRKDIAQQWHSLQNAPIPSTDLP